MQHHLPLTYLQIRHWTQAFLGFEVERGGCSASSGGFGPSAVSHPLMNHHMSVAGSVAAEPVRRRTGVGKGMAGATEGGPSVEGSGGEMMTDGVGGPTPKRPNVVLGPA